MQKQKRRIIPGTSTRRKPIAYGRFLFTAQAILLSVLMARVRPAHGASATQGAAAPAASTQPTTARQNLLAEGNKNFYWVAQVMRAPGVTPPTDQTRIDLRAPDKDAWQHVSDLPARAIGLATVGGQVAVLLDGGDWILLGDDGSGTTGKPLPGGAKMLTFTSDDQTLWAIGAAPNVSTTQPSIIAPATMPATAAGPRLTLFTRKDNAWQPVAPALPENIPADAPLSLAITEHTLYLAVERPNNRVEVLRQSHNGWQQAAIVTGPAKAGAFKLLGGLRQATLWMAHEPSDELTLLFPNAPQKTVKLEEMKAPIPDRTAVCARNAVREIAIVSGKLFEQEYSAETFAPTGKGMSVALPAPVTPPMLTLWYRVALFAALAFAILSSARRRRELKESGPALENVVLADLARRLAAGLIDAFPFIAPIIIGFHSVHAANLNPANPAADANAFIGAGLFRISLAGAWIVYLVHTAASETLTGRTIGKYLLGLRVVRLDGSSPEPAALLIRNFLRVVDVGLMAVPLAFIIFSPLRQRIGDVAGGTIVVRDRVKPEGNLVQPPETDSETQASQPQGDIQPPAAG